MCQAGARLRDCQASGGGAQQRRQGGSQRVRRRVQQRAQRRRGADRGRVRQPGREQAAQRAQQRAQRILTQRHKLADDILTQANRRPPAPHVAGFETSYVEQFNWFGPMFHTGCDLSPAMHTCA